MIKVYIPRREMKFSSEMIILGGLIRALPDDESHHYNKNGEGRYGNLIEWCKKNINYTNDIVESDIIVLPYKFKGIQDRYLQKLLDYDKYVWCFYNDDDENEYPLPNNLVLFRTSMKKSLKKKNEHSLPPLVTNRFEQNIINKPDISIGFVGHVEMGREKYIDVLRKSDLKTDFIIRNGFWAPGIDKKQAVKEYYDNMRNNLYIFCYRGGGNFSYRFFETMMMGRIPILVDTDSSLPFEDKINYEQHIIRIPEKDLSSPSDICVWILKFHQKNKRRLVDIQKSNHELWKNYFSATGFLTQINRIEQ